MMIQTTERYAPLDNDARFIAQAPQGYDTIVQQQQHHHHHHYHSAADDAPPRAGCCVRLVRVALIAFNIIMLLVSAAVLVAYFAGILSNVNDNKDNKAKEIYDNCKFCRRVVITVVSFFGITLVASILGFIAMCSHKCCVIFTYSLIALVMAVLMAGSTATVILYRRGEFDDALAKNWDEIEPKGKCDLQTAFKCSGWEYLCDGSDHGGNVTTMTPITTASPLFSNSSVVAACADCGSDDNLIIGNYTKTCKSQLGKLVKAAYIPVISVSSALAAMCFAVLIVSCVLRRHDARNKRYISQMNENAALLKY